MFYMTKEAFRAAYGQGAAAPAEGGETPNP
jgi:hypothetical protein